MKATSCRHALFLAVALAAAALAGCADVRQDPASSTVGQSDAAAPQGASTQSPSPTSVPF